jgi:hypothetical protein
VDDVLNGITSTSGEHNVLGFDGMDWMEVVVEKCGEGFAELWIPAVRRW